MFRGRYEHSLDAKGRLALPAAFRKALVEAGETQLVVTRHITKPCLVAYPFAAWVAFEERVGALSDFDETIEALQQLYVAEAHECAIDKLGRVVVPPAHRDFAGLTKDCTLVGQVKKLTIWSTTNWQDEQADQKSKVGQDLLRKLSELGL